MKGQGKSGREEKRRSINLQANGNAPTANKDSGQVHLAKFFEKLAILWRSEAFR
jgi:hypothetical protein